MITLKNIHLQIGNQLLLEDENLEIRPGYIHVIMGESGSGKTTLLHELSLLSHLSHASYIWNDKRIDQFNNNERANMRRTHIGYILQDLELISENLSLRDNITCMFALSGQTYNDEIVNEYMKSVNLSCSLDQSIESMSRGERQRFALVLALVKNVDLIICDEPTSALDMENTKELMKHLLNIARKYHKMIVIATHDSYVADCADVLYQIVDKHLIRSKQLITENNNKELKEGLRINKIFYRIYKKSHRQGLQFIFKGIYILMIMLLCIVPPMLKSLLDREEELFQMFSSNEIIMVNTQSIIPNSTYNSTSELFNLDQVNLVKEIENVKEVEYYWELDGSLISEEKTESVLIVPKQNINKVTMSSSLASQFTKNITLYSSLTLENKSYDFEMKIDKYDVKDYPTKTNANREVIYLPTSLMNNMLKEKGVNSSSALTVYCGDVNQVESVTKDIQRWFNGASLTSSGAEHLQQVNNLKMIQEFINILRIVMVFGIIAVAFIIQTMENKAREKEIGNLRINGMNKQSFYQLYYYENIYLFIITFISCLLGYLGCAIIFNTSFSVLNLGIILMQSILYMILTRILPLFITVQQIFKKDISRILRDS
ncbi:MAG: ABC transporter ATP-binding protein [Coprobacillus sp.]